MELWSKFEQDPLFQHSHEVYNLDEMRKLCTLRMYRIREIIRSYSDITSQDACVVSFRFIFLPSDKNNFNVRLFYSIM